MDKLVQSKEADPEEACAGCGLKRRELYARGEMGCARCYETFGAEVGRALREIHGATLERQSAIRRSGKT